jgi:hypothetical protein
VLSFFQHHDLRCLVTSVLLSAPRIAGGALWDGRPTGYGRPPRTVVLELQVLVAIFVWDPGDAALKLAQKSRSVLTVGEAGRKLMFCWLFGSHRRSRKGSGRQQAISSPLRAKYTDNGLVDHHNDQRCINDDIYLDSKSIVAE